MSVQPKHRTTQESEQAEEAPPGVRRQLLLRDVNEEIERVSDRFAVDEGLEVVCECDHGGCFEHISVSRNDYEAVRRFPTRFLVKPEHAAADERIVEEAAAYAVIEKIGHAAKHAIELDPRRCNPSRPTA